MKMNSDCKNVPDPAPVFKGSMKLYAMDEKEEFLDVVTEKGDIIKTLSRAEIHGNPSLLHRVVHMLVFDTGGNLFLQKRSMRKDVAPGKWDTSVGGHVDAGETVEEALHREMREELGITSSDPVFLYTYIHSNAYETELVYTYSCVHEGEMLFNRDEIDELRAWDARSIRENTGKGIFSDNFEHEIEMYSKHKDSRIRGFKPA